LVLDEAAKSSLHLTVTAAATEVVVPGTSSLNVVTAPRAEPTGIDSRDDDETFGLSDRFVDVIVQVRE
jgi:hypothetical protein